jgi:hypothetical protein
LAFFGDYSNLVMPAMLAFANRNHSLDRRLFFGRYFPPPVVDHPLLHTGKGAQKALSFTQRVFPKLFLQLVKNSAPFIRFPEVFPHEAFTYKELGFPYSWIVDFRLKVSITLVA